MNVKSRREERGFRIWGRLWWGRGLRGAGLGLGKAPVKDIVHEGPRMCTKDINSSILSSLRGPSYLFVLLRGPIFTPALPLAARPSQTAYQWKDSVP